MFLCRSSTKFLNNIPWTNNTGIILKITNGSRLKKGKKKIKYQPLVWSQNDFRWCALILNLYICAGSYIKKNSSLIGGGVQDNVLDVHLLSNTLVVLLRNFTGMTLKVNYFEHMESYFHNNNTHTHAHRHAHTQHLHYISDYKYLSIK